MVDWFRLLVPLAQREPFSVSPTGSSADNQRFLEPLLAHVDVFLAEGNLRAVGELLRLGAFLFQSDPEGRYRLERKRIRWLDASAQSAKAQAAMKTLLDQQNRARKNPHRTAELVMELGIMLDRGGDKQGALTLFRQAIRRYTRLGHSYNRAAALFNSASVLYDLGRHAESIKTCVKALQQGGAGQTELEAHVALQMANAYESKGPIHVARDYYHKATTAYARLRNKKQESDILYRLGWMAMRRNQLTEAYLLLQRALELKRELDYGNGLARYHFHRAEACRSVGLHKKAVVHYRTCLSLASSVSNDGLSARAKFGLFRACGAPSQSLPGFLKLSPAPGGEAMLVGGRGGLFRDHRGEGARTELYREGEAGESPRLDRTFLVRLLEDLARVMKGLEIEGSDRLRDQARAVSAWQLRSRRGNK